jgi:hypothetical protein
VCPLSDISLQQQEASLYIIPNSAFVEVHFCQHVVSVIPPHTSAHLDQQQGYFLGDGINLQPHAKFANV